MSDNIGEAKVHAEKALNLSQTHHERYCEGSSWLQLGRVMGKMEGPNFEEAEDCLRNGLRILEELETKPAYAVGCLNLAALYMRAGRKGEALDNLKRSREMFSQMGMEQWLERIGNLSGGGKRDSPQRNIVL
jgi:tetratricopeptide (TPR) repeat protein